VKERSCCATRSDGTPCGAKPLPHEEYCWAHSPRLAQKRRAARKAGGYAKGNAARAQRLVPSMLRPILSLLVGGMQQVYRGELEPSRYTAMSTGASAIVRLFQMAELEQRLEALEQEMRREQHVRHVSP
jgi:hypothetical protein